MDLILETDRLLLRPFQPGDIPAIIAITTNPSISRYMQDMIYDDQEKAAAWIHMLDSLYSEAAPFALLTILLKDGCGPVGYIGVHPKEELDNEVEILYAITDSAQCKGYATEAGKALMNWCFQTAKRPFVTAIIKPDNLPSARAVQKLGFERVGDKTISYNGEATFFHYYRLNKPTKSRIESEE